MKMKLMSRVMQEIEMAETPRDKVIVMRQNDSHLLRLLLHMGLNENLEWMVPPGRPYGYTPCAVPDMENAIYKEARRLYLFHKGGNDQLRQVRRENLWVQFLESIDARDAELMIKIRSKKLPKGVTKKLVLEAFPDIEHQFGGL